MIKITVVTPSYNQAEFLEKTILSVINQKYENLQYIIIDGGSSDESVEIIKKYADHLDFWVSEKDNGQAEAINKGLKIANGDIITWINSDDELLPNALIKVAECFRTNPKFDLLHGNTILHWENGKEIKKKCDEKDLHLKYYGGMPFSQPSAFFTKSVLNKVGFLNEGLNYGMDYDFFLRVALLGEVKFVDRFFSRYLIHAESKTSTSSLHFADEWSVIFDSFLKSLKNSDCQQAMLLGLGFPSSEIDLEPCHTTRKFREEELNFILCYHLLNQIIFRYEGGDLTSVRKITKFIKQNFLSFFEENGLKREFFRSRILTAKSLDFFRNWKTKYSVLAHL